MKKNILTTVLAAMTVLSVSITRAQSPEMMSYQAVIRDASGTLVSNAPIGVRVSILQGSSSGTEVFSETHVVNSNDNGLITFEIGNGTALSGSIASIDWSAGPYFIKNEHDLDGGTNYTLESTSQLLSTPYALHAANGLPDATSGSTAYRSGAQWLANNTLYNDGGYVGINSSNPIGSSSFDVSANTSASQWGGMYINTSDVEGKPFLGFATSYSPRTWFELRGSSNDLAYFNGTDYSFSITGNNHVGIGTDSPTYKLQVNGVTGGFADAGIRIQNTSSGNGWSFYPSSTGNMIIGNLSNLGQFDGTTGAYTSLSDKRLKQNIRPVESVLQNVTDLRILRYEFIHNNPQHKQSIGVLAQELLESFPELVSVHTTNDGNPLVENQLGVDYAGLSVVAIKAIQEQQVLIEQQQLQIDELTRRLEQLEK